MGFHSGIGIALVAIWLISRAGTTATPFDANVGLGVAFGLAAGILFGLMFIGLDQLSDDEVKKELDRAAVRVVSDLDLSGDVSYQDVQDWVRHLDPEGYIRNIELVDELAEAIRAYAPVADIRDLSRAVLGLPSESGCPYTLSGTITVTTATRVDTDVNDVNALVEQIIAGTNEVMGVLGSTGDPGRDLQEKAYYGGTFNGCVPVMAVGIAVVSYLQEHPEIYGLAAGAVG